jgi:hypothetical protein
MLEPALASPGAAFVALRSTLRKSIQTDAVLVLPMHAPRDAFIAMALTQLTTRNAFSGLARQALVVVLKHNKQNSEKLAPWNKLRHT